MASTRGQEDCSPGEAQTPQLFVLALAKRAVVSGAVVGSFVWFNCWPSFPSLIRCRGAHHIQLGGIPDRVAGAVAASTQASQGLAPGSCFSLCASLSLKVKESGSRSARAPSRGQKPNQSFYQRDINRKNCLDTGVGGAHERCRGVPGVPNTGHFEGFPGAREGKGRG